jgi:predicted nucleotidyltransferase
MSRVSLLSPPDTGAIARAVETYAGALRERYGALLKGMYLFGSRARGDFGPYSDVDVAVVLDDSVGEASQTTPLSELAYDVFLQTGAEIQPWAFRETEWIDPEHPSSPSLVRAARRDGRPVPLP